MPGAATQLNAVGGADIPSAAGRRGSRVRAASRHHHSRPEQVVQRHRHLRQVRPRSAARRVHLDLRPERLRQEHADQHDLRPDAVDAGQVLFDGQTIQETRRRYVFQNYRDALFPWLRAIDNIALSAEAHGPVAGASATSGSSSCSRISASRSTSTLSLRAVRRPAADGVDHPRARGRSRRCCFSTSRSRRSTTR